MRVKFESTVREYIDCTESTRLGLVLVPGCKRDLVVDNLCTGFLTKRIGFIMNHSSTCFGLNMLFKKSTINIIRKCEETLRLRTISLQRVYRNLSD